MLSEPFGRNPSKLVTPNLQPLTSTSLAATLGLLAARASSSPLVCWILGTAERFTALASKSRGLFAVIEGQGHGSLVLLATEFSSVWVGKVGNLPGRSLAGLVKPVVTDFSLLWVGKVGNLPGRVQGWARQTRATDFSLLWVGKVGNLPGRSLAGLVTPMNEFCHVMGRQGRQSAGPVPG